MAKGYNFKGYNLSSPQLTIDFLFLSLSLSLLHSITQKKKREREGKSPTYCRSNPLISAAAVASKISGGIYSANKINYLLWLI